MFSRMPLEGLMIFCDQHWNKIFRILGVPRDDHFFACLKFMIGMFPQCVSYVAFPGLKVMK